MVFQAFVKKELPAVTGKNDKGNWEINPFIFEFTEDSPRGPIIHATKVEFSPKRFEIDKIRALIGSNESIEINVSLDVVDYNDGKINKVYVYLRDQSFYKEREY